MTLIQDNPTVQNSLESLQEVSDYAVEAVLEIIDGNFWAETFDEKAVEQDLKHTIKRIFYNRLQNAVSFELPNPNPEAPEDLEPIAEPTRLNPLKAPGVQVKGVLIRQGSTIDSLVMIDD
jgi:hypothetical protein